MKQVFLMTALICTTYILNAQFGYGFTVSNDIYSWYQNPESIGPNEELLDVHEGNGSLLLNLGMGPKIWIGAPKFSFSLEAQAKIGLFGLAVKDFKGLGNHSIPVVGRLNFVLKIFLAHHSIYLSLILVGSTKWSSRLYFLWLCKINF